MQAGAGDRQCVLMNKSIRVFFYLLFFHTTMHASEYINNSENSKDKDPFNMGINIHCACNNDLNINWEIIRISKQQCENLYKLIGDPPIGQNFLLRNNANYNMNDIQR